MSKSIPKHLENWLHSDSSKGSTILRPRNEVCRYEVTGWAFVPTKVKIELQAHNADSAMKLANKKLKSGIQDFIVIGSEDYGAAFGFDATNAELKPLNL